MAKRTAHLAADFTIYAGWFATLAFWQTLGLLPATLLLIGFTAWYMSLQHELIHGHPTRFAWLNQLFGTLPLAVWYPYGLYRDSHLAHHRHDSLTIRWMTRSRTIYRGELGALFPGRSA
jgi:fatty acid desaturase